MNVDRPNTHLMDRKTLWDHREHRFCQKSVGRLQLIVLKCPLPYPELQPKVKISPYVSMEMRSKLFFLLWCLKRPVKAKISSLRLSNRFRAFWCQGTSMVANSCILIRRSSCTKICTTKIKTFATGCARIARHEYIQKEIQKNCNCLNLQCAGSDHQSLDWSSVTDGYAGHSGHGEKEQKMKKLRRSKNWKMRSAMQHHLQARKRLWLGSNWIC